MDNFKKDNDFNLQVPEIISEGMVIQRNKINQIWGWSKPLEEIKLNFMNNTYKTSADERGKWELKLSPQKAGGPYKMKIKMRNNIITISNIMIGDVWICSGQSNMQIPLKRVRDLYEKEIANSKNNKIRYFEVPMNYNFNKPEQYIKSGSWKTTNPKTILDFSAVAYFFARSIYEKYQIPIGLINASVGGSPIESWLSKDILKNYPEYLKIAQKYSDENYVKKIQNEEENRVNHWYQNISSNDKGLNNKIPWYKTELDTSNWSTMEIPIKFSEKGLEDFKGSVWLRKEIKIPESIASKSAILYLGRIVDSDTVYINGKVIGKTGYKYPPRKYKVPTKILRKGKNIISVRVICNDGQGAFIEDKPYKLIIGKKEIDLRGKWKYRVGTEVKKPIPEITNIKWKPMGLFNGMISPLTNYTIRGVIWYQGESNTSNAREYQKLFPELIKNWRKKWNQGKFPFLYVQLPNYGEPEQKQSSRSEWAELREAQLKTLKVDNTAMAVTIDIGEWNDLHPFNKKDVGKRLALAARKKAYGEEIVYSGPIFKSLSVRNDKIYVNFSNTGSGLFVKNDNKLKGFEIANRNMNYQKAEAKIQNDQVVVWNKNVSEPFAVRYAWADNPEEANLYNKEGLPASPFRNILKNPRLFNCRDELSKNKCYLTKHLFFI